MWMGSNSNSEFSDSEQEADLDEDNEEECEDEEEEVLVDDDGEEEVDDGDEESEESAVDEDEEEDEMPDIPLNVYDDSSFQYNGDADQSDLNKEEYEGHMSASEHLNDSGLMECNPVNRTRLAIVKWNIKETEKNMVTNAHNNP